MQYTITSGSIRMPDDTVSTEGQTVNLDTQAALTVRALGVQLTALNAPSASASENASADTDDSVSDAAD